MKGKLEDELKAGYTTRRIRGAFIRSTRDNRHACACDIRPVVMDIGLVIGMFGMFAVAGTFY
jgi:hypothetical protein